MRINGLPVVDATKPTRLVISKTDVAKGKTKDPGSCAAAQACLRQIPECEQARVHLGRTYVLTGKKWVRYNTSKAVRSEIIAFDRGADFQPGEYVLNPMPPSERNRRGKRGGSNAPGARDKGSKSRKPKKPRAKMHVVYGVRAHGANR